MGTFLLIIFIVALALAPLAHFVPSKRQRRIARLREYAAVQGLFVEFRSPPKELASSAGDYRPGSTIYYGLRFPASRRKEPTPGVWLRRHGEWRPASGIKVCPQRLSRLPDDIFAASIDSQSCGIYWQEAGEEGEIDVICYVLQAFANELES